MCDGFASGWRPWEALALLPRVGDDDDDSLPYRPAFGTASMFAVPSSRHCAMGLVAVVPSPIHSVKADDAPGGFGRSYDEPKVPLRLIGLKQCTYDTCVERAGQCCARYPKDGSDFLVAYNVHLYYANKDPVGPPQPSMGLDIVTAIHMVQDATNGAERMAQDHRTGALWILGVVPLHDGIRNYVHNFPGSSMYLAFAWASS